jgi:hypothetical protein
VAIDFFKTLFSTEMKIKLKDKVKLLHLSPSTEGAKLHFCISNLLIFAKLMLKWEEEASKVMNHLIFSLDSIECDTNILQMASMTKSGQLFRRLGYRDLFDNIPFLEEIFNEYKTNQGFQKNCQLLHKLAGNKSLHETMLIIHFIFMSCFDGKRSFSLQQFALKVFKEHQGTNESDLTILKQNLSDGIHKLSDFKEFKVEMSRSDSCSKYNLDIFYPDIDQHLFDLKVVDLEKCCQCDWRY